MWGTVCLLWTQISCDLHFVKEEDNEPKDGYDEEVPEWSTKPLDDWRNEDVIEWCKYNGFLSILANFEGILFIYLLMYFNENDFYSFKKKLL